MVDSGADANILTEKDWDALKRDYNEEKAVIYDLNYKPEMRLRSYGTTDNLIILCTFKAWIETTQRPKPRTFAEFAVVRNGRRSLLGRKTALAMKLLAVGLEVNEVSAAGPVAEFPAIPNLEVNFDIDETVTPTRHAYVSIPAHYRQLANERLAVMTQQGIIERVKTAPKWISGLSAVPKGKNNFRLVVNMRGPNRAIRRQFHAMPRVDEMKTKLVGAKLFTKLDITSAFHHVMLTERSRELTTFMGPDGMYRFKRLVFGVNCAPEIFQRIMEDILGGIKNTIVYIDDVLIYAETAEQLRRATAQVLTALKENNLSVNSEKCEFEQESLTFLGHRLSGTGLDIDGQKIKDIRGFRPPKSTSELRSFLGLASYVSGFIPRFADLTEPMWRASRGKGFDWGEEQENSFQATKRAVGECTTTQGFFDVNDETFLYTDASPHALGAVLVQKDKNGNNRIISFASKTLTDTERRYAQTQREALAVVWAAERFYYYLLGQRFTIRTDALGIAYIFDRKGDAPKRLLRRAEGWAMRLDAFDFDIEFVKGTENIADPSSRLYAGADGAYEENEAPGEIGEIVTASPTEIEFGDDHMPALEIAYHTGRDGELLEAIRALETEEWPEASTPYKLVREELHESNGVLMRTGLAVIPTVLRTKALSLAHKGHPGSTKMKSILRARVWWPKMGDAVENWVSACRTCTLSGRKGPPTPMERARLPAAPWDLVAVDFCGPYAVHNGMSVLVMVDHYSRYTIAAAVRSTDFGSVRAYFNEVFDLFGFPAAIKSDNGPPFTSAEYQRYCRDRGIEMVHSWPLDPQQNGMAERAMQVVAKAMNSSSIDKTNFRTALSEAMSAHNSAVHRTTNAIPNDVMFGRRLRRSLPLTQPALIQVDDEEIREYDWYQKIKAKEREDGKRRAREPSITTGDTVVLRRATKRKGETNYDPTELEVVEQRRGDLTMKAPDGRIVRRNITHAKKVFKQPEAGGVKPDEDEQESQAGTGNEGRPARTRTAPAHLSDYVRSVSAEITAPDV